MPVGYGFPLTSGQKAERFYPLVNSHKAIRALLAALCWVPGAVFAANHFVESFDTLSCAYADTTTVLPSGTWTVNNVYNEEAVASRGGTGHAAQIGRAHV